MKNSFYFGYNVFNLPKVSNLRKVFFAKSLKRRNFIGTYQLFHALTFLLIATILNSCIKTPVEPNIIETGNFSTYGAYILSEGLMGMDNSGLTRYDIETGFSSSDYFKQANPGLRIGDTANDMVIQGDTAYIAMTTAKSIEAFRVSDGKYLGRIQFEGNAAPRKICLVNDTIAYVSQLYTAEVSEFNPKNLTFSGKNISVGPAPEGIVNIDNLLFVANSGYGDYLADKPKASTISVIDINNNIEIAVLTCGKNPTRLIADNKNKIIYAAYFNLPSLRDSLEGIVCYDVVTLKEKWRKSLRMLDFSGLALSPGYDILYYFSPDGLNAMNTNDNTKPAFSLIKKNNPNDMWYSLAINKDDNTIWIGNARNYLIDGEIMIYSIGSFEQPLKQFTVGINPNTIIFYK